MIDLLTYPSGLRVVVDRVDTVQTVCAGIWVGSGSVNEHIDDNGIAHFTEHMLFKGTDKLSAYDIADKFESVGAAINAFTSKENTCYYFKCVDKYTEVCFSTLADAFFDSAFDKVELDKERKVIIEEINMGEDSPEDLCFDLIASVNYGTHPLGRRILGTIDNVSRFDKESIHKYMGSNYVASNIVLSFCGNIDASTVDKIVQKTFAGRTLNAKFGAPKLQRVGAFANKCDKYIKDFEQAKIIVNSPSIDFGSKEA